MSMQSLYSSPVGELTPIEKGLTAYVPVPVPRSVPLTESLVKRLAEAALAVGELKGVGETIPNPWLLISPLMGREAVLSSRIEGTLTSMSDLLIYEAGGGERRDDTFEVANYRRALLSGLKQAEELPISLRLANQLHEILMQDVRGQDKMPGQFRTSQTYIGSGAAGIENARFIPPPARYLRDLFFDWEKFVNDDLPMHPLVQCALMHYQFETIHPYLDGNGRMGRLLIVLFLHARQILSTPLLYMSAYFERDRDLYCDELFNVSRTGDWQRWIEYFLTGVNEQAKDAMLRVRRVRGLQDSYRQKLQSSRVSQETVVVMEAIFESLVLSAPKAASILGLTPSGARQILDRLVQHGVVDKLDSTWPRLYMATELLEAIHEPSEAANLS